MLSMTATVASIDSETVKLINVKKCAYYEFPNADNQTWHLVIAESQMQVV